MDSLTRMTKRFSSEAGAELIEFALTLPVLLLVLFGIIDFGFMCQRYEVVTNAARESARMRSLPNYTDADAIARADTYLASAGMDPSKDTTAVEAVTIDTGAGCMRGFRVNVSYPHTFLLVGEFVNWFGGGLGDVTLTASSEMRAEAGGTVNCP